MNKLRVGFAALLAIVPFLGFSQTQGTGIIIGQDTTNHVINTAVPFLTITPDSRAAGMGDVGVATSADANGAFWNAGKMAFVDRDFGVSGSYTPWLAKIINDMSIFYLSGFYKVKRGQTIAASMKYFNLGAIQFNHGPSVDQQDGRYNPREFAFDVTYSQLLTEHLGLGGSLRYINSNLTGAVSNVPDARPGNSLAFDIGVFYTKPLVSKNSNVSFGATITNFGSKITYSDADRKSFIPTMMRLGGAYKTEVNAYHSFTFALDLSKLLVPSPGNSNASLMSGVFGSFSDARGGGKEELREIMASGGVEYLYNNVFAGRAGYFLEAKDKGNRKYMTFGVGGHLERFALDVAYLVPTNKRENALAETVRISILINFEKAKKEVKENESVTD